MELLDLKRNYQRFQKMKYVSDLNKIIFDNRNLKLTTNITRGVEIFCASYKIH